MKKIPTVFVREQDRRFVTREVTPGCEWALEDPAAVATRKYDGTCVMLDEQGRWWARREVKPGKAEPAVFILVQADDVTGKVVGWEPMDQSALIRHAHAERLDAPRDFDGLAAWLREHPFEGIVWHHPDGRMAKLKARDFPRVSGGAA